MAVIFNPDERCVRRRIAVLSRRFFKRTMPRLWQAPRALSVARVMAEKNSYVINMNRNTNLHWYHRSVTRDEADELLKNSENGIFLVRDSNTSPGDFVLSVLFNDEVFHYQIRHHGEDAFYSIDDQTPIHGLDSLIEYYQENPEGLVTQLTGIYPGGGPPPAEARRHGRTNLLHRATKNGNLLVVEEMLMSNNKKNTYPLDAKDQDGRSAVHLACLLDNNAESILGKLIESGANVNCRDEEGNTPLHYACRTKPLSLIKMLVEANAQINARNNDTWRVPLHEAAQSGNLDVVKYLLELKIPHLPRSTNEETPIQLAREAGRTETAEFLESYRPPDPTIEESQYCHGTMDRSESEKIIRKFVKDNNIKDEDTAGVFLVRHSLRERRWILGVLNEENVVRHYVINESPQHFHYIDEGPYMYSLNHLVQHYMRFSDGLPTKLRHSVPPRDKPPLPPLHPQGATPPKASKISIFSPWSKGSKENESVQASPPHSKQRTKSLPSDGSSSSPKNATSDSPQGAKKKPGNLDTLKKTLKRTLGGKSKSIENTLDANASNGTNNSSILNSSIAQKLDSLSFKANEPAEIYNVPPNNQPISQVNDIENGNTVLSSARLEQLPNSQRSKKLPNGLDKFTRSDKATNILISDQYNEEPKGEEIYFVEPPTKVVPFSVVSSNCAAAEQPYASNALFSPINNSNIDQINSNFAIDPMMMIRSDRFDVDCSFESTVSNDFEMICAQIEDRRNPTSPCYYIPSSSVTRITQLGEGAFGTVWKSTMLCEGPNGEPKKIEVAVKTLIDDSVNNRKEFLREAHLMIKLKHPYVVQMIGISKGPPLMIVQELVPEGSLHEYLVDNKAKIRPGIELKIWASQIACGMNYLERQHFVHRDLAARNILVASLHQVKISDFGLSRALGVNKDYYIATTFARWPVKWYAPECIHLAKFSHASDVWSFGVTLWEMYTFGAIPYEEMSTDDMRAFIEVGRRLAIPENCPIDVYETMTNCWNYKPENRPTFQYLTEFFSSDYQNIFEIIKAQNNIL